MAKFSTNQSLSQFQSLIGDIYSLPDDRLYSLWDLLTQQQRFTMRALKGIRKSDRNKLKQNLLISLSWVCATANRLHVDLESDVWKRFPAVCSYCGTSPCTCSESRPINRKNVVPDESLKPTKLKAMQTMFEDIYPAKSRTLAAAGVHLAEEMGEVSEAIHNFLGQHQQKQFTEIELEMSDYVSCLFGVANSADIDVAKELSIMYSDNCHVCHQKPCACTFASISTIET